MMQYIDAGQLYRRSILTVTLIVIALLSLFVVVVVTL